MTFNVDRTFVSFPIIDLLRIKQQMLSWADRFGICCFLDNHGYGLPGHTIECLLGAGALDFVRGDAGGTPGGGALDRLHDFVAGRKDWLFGHLGYGLARETEPPPSGVTGAETRMATDRIGFPDLFFFVPEVVVELRSDRSSSSSLSGVIRIGSFKGDQEMILEQIMAMPAAGRADLPPGNRTGSTAPMTPMAPMTARFSREEYLATVRRLREHIHRGDCYEINFCQEFYSTPAEIDPLLTWFSLSRSSPNPFAAYYKLDHRYLLCASPERYLKRTGNTLLSQPIKGTSPRENVGVRPVVEVEVADQTGRDRLYVSIKDRAENVMVVDLVRNDLSKLCLEGSVRVGELYGIYTFPQVHQMISTVSGELPPDTGLTDCIRATFPMGSMTGAPKNRVVGLIAETERIERGLFSGAVGYVTPDGDFDLNVVIRSILYNAENKYVSYQVGSGITFYSDPEQEYEECLWKAEGIKKALGI